MAEDLTVRGKSGYVVRRSTFRALAVVSAAILIVALPAVAFAESGFDTQTRSAASTAIHSLTSTENQLPGRHYPYYTLGPVWATSGPTGWVSGYLPGELWTAYALTGDSWFRAHAATRQAPIGRSSVDASSTDIGIRYFYSYARGYELTHNAAYRKIALDAAAGEAARFNPKVGLVRSRNTAPACEVIIDEMMNLQVLYWGADHGGSARWSAIAHEHALTAANYFVRPDGSVYHVLEFDPTTGDLVGAQAGQGYSATSMWARGQAWAIHGFSTAYRHTADVVMLQTARSVANRYLVDLPSDFVPYWDFRDPDIPYAPRDSSAAAIAASGLLDLAMTDPMPQNRARYLAAAKSTLASLESPAYLSTGTIPAILTHGTMNHHS